MRGRSVIGSGSFGTVYGPYDIQEISMFLSDTKQETMIQRVRSHEKYIIKIIHKYRRGDRRRIETAARIINDFQNKKRLPRWITPLIVGTIHRSKLIRMLPGHTPDQLEYLFEIQRYGGHDLLELLQDRSLIISPSTIRILWKSIIEILDVGLTMIDHGYLLSDLKIENMVFDFEHGLFMIDPEIYRMDELIKTKHPITVSPYPQNLPIQFLNDFFFTRSMKAKLLDKYIRSWTGSDKERNGHTIRQLLSAMRWSQPFDRKEMIRHVAVLTLFYPFMVMMIRCLDQFEMAKQFKRIQDFCYHVLKTRAAGDPRTLWKEMKMMAAEQQQSSARYPTMRPFTLKQNYVLSTTK